MYKRIKHISSLLLGAGYCLIMGCSRIDYDDPDYILNNAEKIKLGMERKEIIDILGPPSASFFNEKKTVQEVFFYKIPLHRFTNELNDRPTNFIISIQSNKVIHAGMMWEGRGG